MRDNAKVMVCDVIGYNNRMFFITGKVFFFSFLRFLQEQREKLELTFS